MTTTQPTPRSSSPAPAWTPGPWTYQMTISSSGPVPQVQTVPVGPDGGRYSTLICTLSRTGEKSGTREANARLIAAAPEMAEALRELLEDEWRMSPDWGPQSEREPILAKARALLARINGEGGSK